MVLFWNGVVFSRNVVIEIVFTKEKEVKKT